MSSPASIRKDSKNNNDSPNSTPNPRTASGNNNNKPPTFDLLTILNRNPSPTLQQLTAHVKSLAEYVKDLSAYIAAQANTSTTPSTPAQNTPSKTKENESSSTETENIMLHLTPLLEQQLKTLSAVEDSTNDSYKLCAQLGTTVRAALEAYDENFKLRVQILEREVQAVKSGLGIILLERMEGEGRGAETGAVPLKTILSAAEGSLSGGKKGKGKGRRG